MLKTHQTKEETKEKAKRKQTGERRGGRREEGRKERGEEEGQRRERETRGEKRELEQERHREEFGFTTSLPVLGNFSPTPDCRHHTGDGEQPVLVSLSSRDSGVPKPDPSKVKDGL